MFDDGCGKLACVELGGALVGEQLQRPREVVLDWTALTFMDSSGIRLLFLTLALCRNQNIDLTWALGDTARETLDRVGIHDALLRDYSAGTGKGPTYDS